MNHIEAGMNKFKRGDLVTLKSGGPVMTVLDDNITAPNGQLCHGLVYFNDITGRIARILLPEHVLVLVEIEKRVLQHG